MRLALAGLAAAVLCGVAAFLVTNALNNSGPQAGPPLSTDSPSPEDASPSPGVSLNGYTLTTDPAGFSFQLPSDGRTWVRTVRNNQIYYSPDNQVHYLQFAVAVGDSTTPLQHFQEMERTVSLQPAYKVASMKSLKFRGHDAAYWEWTQALNGVSRHVVEEEFIDTDGTSYAILQACPEADWLQGQRSFRTVLNNFTPIR